MMGRRTEIGVGDKGGGGRGRKWKEEVLEQELRRKVRSGGEHRIKSEDWNSN